MAKRRRGEALLRVAQFRDAREGRPAWMRVLGAAGRWLPRLAAPSAQASWRSAHAAVPDGLPDPAAVQALAALVASLERDARLHLVGRIAARDDSARLARTHLRIEAALRREPAILATALPEPLLIVGWPRTGTTFLHTLLAEDPAHRTIPYWESFDPVPPRAGPDRRIERLDRMLARLAGFAPGYQAIHPMAARQAEECVALFMNVFRTLQFDIQYRVPGYVEWLLAQDARIAYEAWARQLRLVQYHRPCGERFVLKDPTHLVHLETALQLFPRARVVFTHRDPARAFSSIASLYAHTRAIFSDDVDPRALGRELLAGYWPPALERALALRERLPAGRVADVRHADLVRDPLGTALRLYRDLGLELGGAAREALRRFAAARDAGPRREHEHSPEAFGIDAAALRERFASYCQRFAL